MMRKRILVTGAHRSGTTWAGKMLAIAPGTAYVHEPFNPIILAGRFGRPFPNWFQYICEENAEQYKEYLRDVITYNYPLGSNVARARTFRDVARIARDQARSLLHRARDDTAIVKDPIACFSADWMAHEFDMNVLVMIRHPAAFASSLKIIDWRFDFSNFLRQSLLMEGVLKKFQKEIEEQTLNEQNIISQAIVLWNCTHHLIRIYQEEHPEWLFVRHEDLSINPVAQFRSIYEAFDLEFTPKVKSAILASSGPHNPTERRAGKEFVRNSKENIHTWKNRLTESEVQAVKEGTYEISRLFYTENEW